MMFENKKLSHEQLSIVESFNDCRNLLVSASAGTSKSFTMLACASQTNRTGIFLSFNKRDALSSANRAKSNKNLTVKTTDAFIYEVYRKLHNPAARVSLTTFDQSTWAKHSEWDKPPIEFKFRSGKTYATLKYQMAPFLAGSALSRLVTWMIINPDTPESRTDLSRYIVKDSSSIASRLVYKHRYELCKNNDDHYVESLKSFKSEVYRNALAMVNHLVPIARRISKYLIENSNKGKSKVVTLEVMARTVYELKYKFSELGYQYVIADEFQDVNMLTLGILNNQTDIQVVAVGDDRQEIYGWRGANRAMDKFEYTHKRELSIAYRYSKTIANEVKQIINRNVKTAKPADPNSFNANVDKLDLNNIDVVLATTNSVLLQTATILLDRGFIPIMSSAGSAASKAFLKDYVERKTKTHTFKNRFSKMTDVQFSQIVLTGLDAALVDFVSNQFGQIDQAKLASIMSVLNGDVAGSGRTIELRTVHTAKGGEWDRVLVLYSPRLIDDKAVRFEAENVLYVAITRGKDRTDYIQVKDFLEKYAKVITDSSADDITGVGMLD